MACLGSCAQAPVMMIDDNYYGRVPVASVPKILKIYKKPKDEEITMPKFESIDQLREYRRKVTFRTGS